MTVADTDGERPGASVFAPEAEQRRGRLMAVGDAAGRTGLLVGGGFALAGVGVAFFVVRLALAATFDGAPGLIATFLLAAGSGWALLVGVDRGRGTELEPVAVVAAVGTTGFFAVAAGAFVAAFGAGPGAVAWVAVVVALPLAWGLLCWLAHPLLGLDVAAAVVVLVALLPADAGARAGLGGRSLLVAVLLAGAGVTVDLATGRRVGSLLHYGALVAALVAKVVVVLELPGPAAVSLLAGLALAELLVGVLLDRRSWRLDSAVTAVLVLLGVLGTTAFESVPGGLAAGLAVAPAAVVALAAAAGGPNGLRRALLAALPPPVARSLGRPVVS